MEAMQPRDSQAKGRPSPEDSKCSFFERSRTAPAVMLCAGRRRAAFAAGCRAVGAGYGSLSGWCW